MRIPLALLSVTLIFVACSSSVSTGVSLDKRFKVLIDPKTRVLAAIDVDGLKKSGVYRRHEKALNFPLLNASSERLGFDPRRDISDLVITSAGSDTLLLIRGSFQEKAVQVKLSSLGLKRHSFQGYDVLGDERESVAFAGGKIALTGPANVVQSALEMQGRGDVPEGLGKLMSTLPKNDQMWAVSQGQLPFSGVPMPSDVQSAMSNIVAYISETATALKLDDGVHLESTLHCISPEGARRVHDALRGGIAIGRLSTKDNETDLLKIYDAVQVDQDGTAVRVHADVPADLTDKLIGYLPRR